jgi:glycosyltransferase involved in cell wall biosynthesis
LALLAMINPRMVGFKVMSYLARRLGRRDWLAGKLDDSGLQLVAQFKAAFPDRPDQLVDADLFGYQGMHRYFRDVFRHFDIVQCYSTEPIVALLAGKRPYVGFEHGTLRVFTMGDDPIHRLTALAYRMADHTFITNGDCLAYAERLGIKNYSPTIHPVDVEQHRRDYGNSIAKLRRDIDADVVLFCPTRHDWEEKGTDRFIRALPLIKQRVPGRVKLILAEWGQQVAESKRLVAELGCTENVIWKPTMCRVSMIKHIRAADVVFDQMNLPVFGSTVPQTLAAGKPVVGSYVPAETQWLFPEPAPVLSAFSPEEVAAAVEHALQPEWRAEHEKRARRWIDKFHHPNNVIENHLRVYRSVLNQQPAGDRSPAP